MPFDSVEDVRSRVDSVEGMSDKQVRAYMDAFNGCVDRHGSEEGEDHNCFAIATKAAKNAGGGD